ncbi:MAG: hypothetical protein CSA29_03340 [Desulfobacterales bacterium]|nr:MAG: hypothetical protein CSA29_03340 [Desulfobacterales bacterium]
MGPMTGKRKGLCVSKNSRPKQDQGARSGRCGCRRRNSAPNGYGRGFGFKNRNATSSTSKGTVPKTQEELNRRAETLTQELNAVKNKLKNFAAK